MNTSQKTITLTDEGWLYRAWLDDSTLWNRTILCKDEQPLLEAASDVDKMEAVLRSFPNDAHLFTA